MSDNNAEQKDLLSTQKAESKTPVTVTKSESPDKLKGFIDSLGSISSKKRDELYQLLKDQVGINPENPDYDKIALQLLDNKEDHLIGNLSNIIPHIHHLRSFFLKLLNGNYGYDHDQSIHYDLLAIKEYYQANKVMIDKDVMMSLLNKYRLSYICKGLGSLLQNLESLDEEIKATILKSSDLKTEEVADIIMNIINLFTKDEQKTILMKYLNSGYTSPAQAVFDHIRNITGFSKNDYKDLLIAYLNNSCKAPYQDYREQIQWLLQKALLDEELINVIFKTKNFILFSENYTLFTDIGSKQIILSLLSNYNVYETDNWIACIKLIPASPNDFGLIQKIAEIFMSYGRTDIFVNEYFESISFETDEEKQKMKFELITYLIWLKDEDNKFINEEEEEPEDIGWIDKEYGNIFIAIKDHPEKEMLLLASVRKSVSIAESLLALHREELEGYSNSDEVIFCAETIWGLGVNDEPLRVIEDNTRRAEIIISIIDKFNAHTFVKTYLFGVSHYSTAEKQGVLRAVFDQLQIRYDHEKIFLVAENLDALYQKLALDEIIPLFEKDTSVIQKLINIEAGDKQSLVLFRIDTLWDEADRQQFYLVKTYLETKKLEYETWTKNNPELREAYELPRTEDPLNILVAYLPKDNYHMALDGLNEENLVKFEIYDLVDLLNNKIPNANPTDTGRDKFEIWSSLMADFMTPNFIENLFKSLVNKGSISENDIARLSDPEDRHRLKTFISNTLHEEGSFDSLLALHKRVRVLAAFTKKEYEVLLRYAQTPETKPIHDYFIALLEHETASLDAMKDELMDPEQFFQNHCTHDQYEINPEINPFNWVYVGDSRVGVRVALSAEDIRDTLILGGLNKLGFFKYHKKEIHATLSSSSKTKIIAQSKKELERLDTDIFGYLQDLLGSKIALDKQERLEYEKELNSIALLEIFDHKKLYMFLKENKEAILKKIVDDKQRETLYRTLRNVFNRNNLKIVLDIILQYTRLTANYVYHQLGGASSLRKSLRNNQRIQALLSTKRSNIVLVLRENNVDLHQYEEFINRLKRRHHIEDLGEAVTLRAEILMPDNPRRATVGNDTGSCDGYGDGKRVQYDFNPACGQFALSFVNKNPKTGKERVTVIAQSLLTIDTDVSQFLLPTLVKNRDHRLVESLGEDFLERYFRSPQKILSLDNIEQNKAYAGRVIFDNAQLGQIYRQFFIEYLKMHPELKQDIFLVGTTFNDPNIIRDIRAKSTANNYLPSTVIPYSDKAQERCYKVETNIKNRAKQPRLNGVFEINYLDAIPVSYLEEFIYKYEEGADEHLEGLLDMQNLLIASAYTNEKFGISSLNMGYFDREGVLRGYILAYPVTEGSEGYDEYGEYDDQQKEELAIYVHDWAVMKEYRRSGGTRSIVSAVIPRIKKNIKILRKRTGQDSIDILMQCRAETSYKFMLKYSGQIGYEIIEDYETDNGMHVLRLRDRSSSIAIK